MNKGAKKFRRTDSAVKVSMSTSCCTDNVILNDSNETPNPLSNNSSNSQLTKVNLDEIKVISVNCCSL